MQLFAPNGLTAASDEEEWKPANAVCRGSAGGGGGTGGGGEGGDAGGGGEGGDAGGVAGGTSGGLAGDTGGVAGGTSGGVGAGDTGGQAGDTGGQAGDTGGQAGDTGGATAGDVGGGTSGGVGAGDTGGQAGDVGGGTSGGFAGDLGGGFGGLAGDLGGLAGVAGVGGVPADAAASLGMGAVPADLGVAFSGPQSAPAFGALAAAPAASTPQEAALTDVTNPASPNYGQALSFDQMSSLMGQHAAQAAQNFGPQSAFAAAFPTDIATLGAIATLGQPAPGISTNAAVGLGPPIPPTEPPPQIAQSSEFSPVTEFTPPSDQTDQAAPTGGFQQAATDQQIPFDPSQGINPSMADTGQQFTADTGQQIADNQAFSPAPSAEGHAGPAPVSEGSALAGLFGGLGGGGIQAAGLAGAMGGGAEFVPLTTAPVAPGAFDAAVAGWPESQNVEDRRGETPEQNAARTDQFAPPLQANELNLDLARAAGRSDITSSPPYQGPLPGDVERPEAPIGGPGSQLYAGATGETSQLPSDAAGLETIAKEMGGAEAAPIELPSTSEETPATEAVPGELAPVSRETAAGGGTEDHPTAEFSEGPERVSSQALAATSPGLSAADAPEAEIPPTERSGTSSGIISEAEAARRGGTAAERAADTVPVPTQEQIDAHIQNSPKSGDLSTARQDFANQLMDNPELMDRLARILTIEGGNKGVGLMTAIGETILNRSDKRDEGNLSQTIGDEKFARGTNYFQPSDRAKANGEDNFQADPRAYDAISNILAGTNLARGATGNESKDTRTGERAGGIAVIMGGERLVFESKSDRPSEATTLMAGTEQPRAEGDLTNSRTGLVESQEVRDARDFLVSTATPAATMTTQGVERAIDGLHPEFATALAGFIEAARTAGYDIGVTSGFRTVSGPGSLAATGQNSNYATVSQHGSGVAADLRGIDMETRLGVAPIAADFGLTFPYELSNRAELNHIQLAGTGKVAEGINTRANAEGQALADRWAQQAAINQAFLGGQAPTTMPAGTEQPPPMETAPPPMEITPPTQALPGTLAPTEQQHANPSVPSSDIGQIFSATDPHNYDNAPWYMNVDYEKQGLGQEKGYESRDGLYRSGISGPSDWQGESKFKEGSKGEQAWIADQIKNAVEKGAPYIEPDNVHQRSDTFIINLMHQIDDAGMKFVGKNLSADQISRVGNEIGKDGSPIMIGNTFELDVKNSATPGEYADVRNALDQPEMGGRWVAFGKGEQGGGFPLNSSTIQNNAAQTSQYPNMATHWAPVEYRNDRIVSQGPAPAGAQTLNAPGTPGAVTDITGGALPGAEPAPVGPSQNMQFESTPPWGFPGGASDQVYDSALAGLPMLSGAHDQPAAPDAMQSLIDAGAPIASLDQALGPYGPGPGAQTGMDISFDPFTNAVRAGESQNVPFQSNEFHQFPGGGLDLTYDNVVAGLLMLGGGPDILQQDQQAPGELAGPPMWSMAEQRQGTTGPFGEPPLFQGPGGLPVEPLPASPVSPVERAGELPPAVPADTFAGRFGSLAPASDLINPAITGPGLGAPNPDNVITSQALEPPSAAPGWGENQITGLGLGGEEFAPPPGQEVERPGVAGATDADTERPLTEEEQQQVYTPPDFVTGPKPPGTPLSAIQIFDKISRAHQATLPAADRAEAQRYSSYATTQMKADLLSGKLTPIEFMVQVANREPGIIITRTADMIRGSTKGAEALQTLTTGLKEARAAIGQQQAVQEAFPGARSVFEAKMAATPQMMADVNAPRETQQPEIVPAGPELESEMPVPMSPTEPPSRETLPTIPGIHELEQPTAELVPPMEPTLPPSRETIPTGPGINELQSMQPPGAAPGLPSVPVAPQPGPGGAGAQPGPGAASPGPSVQISAPAASPVASIFGGIPTSTDVSYYGGVDPRTAQQAAQQRPDIAQAVIAAHPAEVQQIAMQMRVSLAAAAMIFLQQQGTPAMAGGGYLSPGQEALVGEQGPEMFVPNMPGTIVPMTKTAPLNASRRTGYPDQFGSVWTEDPWGRTPEKASAEWPIEFQFPIHPAAWDAWLAGLKPSQNIEDYRTPEDIARDNPKRKRK